MKKSQRCRTFNAGFGTRQVQKNDVRYTCFVIRHGVIEIRRLGARIGPLPIKLRLLGAAAYSSGIRARGARAAPLFPAFTRLASAGDLITEAWPRRLWLLLHASADHIGLGRWERPECSSSQGVPPCDDRWRSCRRATGVPELDQSTGTRATSGTPQSHVWAVDTNDTVDRSRRSSDGALPGSERLTAYNPMLRLPLSFNHLP
jgi:hypothetical protein